MAKKNQKKRKGKEKERSMWLDFLKEHMLLAASSCGELEA